MVADALESDGWTVLARNWRGGNGELDIVVLREGRLRFVEVKARDLDDPVGLEAVDGWKRNRLGRAARAWLTANVVPHDEVCFLVALVEVVPEGTRVTWLDDAFDVPLDG